MSDHEETIEEPASARASERQMLSASKDIRAVAGIRRAKGFGGLAGFAIAALAAELHGELAASLLLRGLIGGVAGYMVGWLAAVTVWRRIIRAELHHGLQEIESARALRALDAETQ